MADDQNTGAWGEGGTNPYPYLSRPKGGHGQRAWDIDYTSDRSFAPDGEPATKSGTPFSNRPSFDPGKKPAGTAPSANARSGALQDWLANGPISPGAGSSSGYGASGQSGNAWAGGSNEAVLPLQGALPGIDQSYDESVDDGRLQADPGDLPWTQGPVEFEEKRNTVFGGQILTPDGVLTVDGYETPVASATRRTGSVVWTLGRRSDFPEFEDPRPWTTLRKSTWTPRPRTDPTWWVVMAFSGLVSAWAVFGFIQRGVFGSMMVGILVTLLLVGLLMHRFVREPLAIWKSTWAYEATALLWGFGVAGYGGAELGELVMGYTNARTAYGPGVQATIAFLAVGLPIFAIQFLVPLRNLGAYSFTRMVNALFWGWLIYNSIPLIIVGTQGEPDAGVVPYAIVMLLFLSPYGVGTGILALVGTGRWFPMRSKAEWALRVAIASVAGWLTWYFQIKFASVFSYAQASDDTAMALTAFVFVPIALILFFISRGARDQFLESKMDRLQPWVNVDAIWPQEVGAHASEKGRKEWRKLLPSTLNVRKNAKVVKQINWPADSATNLNRYKIVEAQYAEAGIRFQLAIDRLAEITPAVDAIFDDQLSSEQMELLADCSRARATILDVKTPEIKDIWRTDRSEREARRVQGLFLGLLEQRLLLEKGEGQTQESKDRREVLERLRGAASSFAASKTAQTQKRNKRT